MSKDNAILLAVIVAAIIAFAATGCTDAEFARMRSLGNEHHIELYSGGEKVREWTSTGKVLSEARSDGYYFNDKETGELIRVTGDLVIQATED